MAYTEAQREQFCGIHAFNMLFQERKLVWVEEGPEFINQAAGGGAAGMDDVDAAYTNYAEARLAFQIAEARTGELERALTKLRRNVSAKTPAVAGTRKAPPAAENAQAIKDASKGVTEARAAQQSAEADMTSAKDEMLAAADAAEATDDFTNRGIALNMAVKCQDVADASNGLNAGVLCTSDGIGYDGQIPYEILQEIIEELGYTVEFGLPEDWTDTFDRVTVVPHFIGILINFRHPVLFRHYAAVIKHTGGGGGGAAVGFADPAAEPIITYLSMAAIKTRIAAMRAAGDLNLLMFVTAKADSAPTVALDRMQAPAGGKTRRRRRMGRRGTYKRRNF